MLNDKKNKLKAPMSHCAYFKKIFLYLPGFLFCACIFSAGAQEQVKAEEPSADASKTRQKASTVYINGKPVVTRKDFAAHARKNMPASLKDKRVQQIMQQRHKIRYYDHSPMSGGLEAPITILEMTDLSCVQCMDLIREVEKIRAKFSNDVRYVYVHLPLDVYNGSNPAAFYGRLAQYYGVFEDYRSSLLQLDDASENVYLQKLLEAGVGRREMRDVIRRQAREFYKQLDADTQLAKRYGVERPPAIFVNGIRVGGDNGLPVDLLEDLLKYEIAVYKAKKAANDS